MYENRTIIDMKVDVFDPAEDIKKMKESGLIRTVGKNIEITDKGAEVIKIMVLGDDRSTFEDNDLIIDAVGGGGIWRSDHAYAKLGISKKYKMKQIGDKWSPYVIGLMNSKGEVIIDFELTTDHKARDGALSIMWYGKHDGDDDNYSRSSKIEKVLSRI